MGEGKKHHTAIQNTKQSITLVSDIRETRWKNFHIQCDILLCSATLLQLEIALQFLDR